MATKKTLKMRATIAARFSILMRDPAFNAKAKHVLPTDSDGDYSIVVADPEESAALTMHRMEKLGEHLITVLSTVDNVISATVFSGNANGGFNDNRFPVPGSMTVEEWLKKVNAGGKTVAYSADGSEFAGEISSISQGSLTTA